MSKKIISEENKSVDVGEEKKTANKEAVTNSVADNEKVKKTSAGIAGSKKGTKKAPAKSTGVKESKIKSEATVYGKKEISKDIPIKVSDTKEIKPKSKSNEAVKKEISTQSSAKAATSKKATKKSPAKAISSKKTTKRTSAKVTGNKENIKNVSDKAMEIKETLKKPKASEKIIAEEVKVSEIKTEASKKKIAFVASECLPFAATGGLGEVIGSLPKALAKNNDLDITVFLPLYSCISDENKHRLEYICNFTVNLAWRKQYCGIFRLKEDNVTYYFIDNEYYFNRDGLYGYYDDGERFAYFCHAVLDSWPILNYVPDIVHAHDWQSALVPVYLTTKYYYPDIKTIFTIHNIEYQGKYDLAIMGDVFDLCPEAGKYLEYKGCINLMKGAIAASNMVTTVSQSYAKELMDPFYAHGLSNIINSYQYKMTGILNGIDTDLYNAGTDTFITKNFSSLHPEGKALCKQELQKICNLPQRADVPVVAMITRLVSHKGIDLVSAIADRLLADADIQLVILGCGDTDYEEYFKGLAYRHSDKASALICYNKELSHKVYAGADFFLMPSKSEPCGLAQMISSRYGTVPIVRKTGGLGDSIKDCRLGEGNGFVFENYNADEMYNCIISALNVYANKKDFNTLVKYIMTLDFSWNKSAEEYKKMYNSIK